MRDSKNWNLIGSKGVMKKMLAKVYDLLYQLGMTSNYTGFHQTAYAVWLCMEQPGRLLRVTKWVYPAVAKHYDTN